MWITVPSPCDSDVCGSGARGQAVTQKVTDLGIRLFVISIVSLDIATIKCLADAQDVFQVASFSDTDSKSLVKDDKPILCGGNTKSYSSTKSKTNTKSYTIQPKSRPTSTPAISSLY